MQRHSLVLGVALVCVSPFSVQAAQRVFVVSPSGNDSNPGTETKPFRTIAHARDRVAAINRKMSDDIVVSLRGGTYTLSSSVLFDANDSGTNGHKVVYRAFPGETPIVCGGRAVKGWTLHD